MSENERQLQKISNSKTHRIHRRKNGEITKEFECTEGCGKAYGSYAALYTHIKNKHGHVKPPQMKTNKPKVGRKGRPQTKQSEMKYQDPDGECKICNQSPCQCVERYDTEQKKRITQIMGSQEFINFVNQVGGLYKNTDNIFIRNTQQDFRQLTQHEIIEMLSQFNQKFRSNLKLNKKMLAYLCFSSQYWNIDTIKELYNGIFAIKTNLMADSFIKKNQQHFPNLANCVQLKQSDFQAFVCAVNAI